MGWSQGVGVVEAVRAPPRCYHACTHTYTSSLLCMCLDPRGTTRIPPLMRGPNNPPPLVDNNDSTAFLLSALGI